MTSSVSPLKEEGLLGLRIRIDYRDLSSERKGNIFLCRSIQGTMELYCKWFFTDLLVYASVTSSKFIMFMKLCLLTQVASLATLVNGEQACYHFPKPIKIYFFLL